MESLEGGGTGPAVLSVSRGREARDRIRCFQANDQVRRLSSVFQGVRFWRNSPQVDAFTVLNWSFLGALGVLTFTACSWLNKAGLCLPEQTGLFLRWEGYSAANPHSSAFMKRRTVQRGDAAKGPHLRGQSCNQPTAQLSPGGGGGVGEGGLSTNRPWLPHLCSQNKYRGGPLNFLKIM